MKIVVLYGGISPEREVSLNSGAAVAEALRDYGYDAQICDVTSIKEFVLSWESFSADGAFIALHGGWGENGQIQAVLESFGIPYTGSGSQASMLAMNKQLAKELFREAGVKTPEGFVATRARPNDELAAEFLKKYGKLAVKPNCGGSTVGLSFVTEIGEYRGALEKVWELEETAIIERYITGEEATAAVWEREDGRVEALPPIHIKPKIGYYDYRNKYTEGCTEYICPSDFEPEVNARIAQDAVAAHCALGCRAYSRVDFRITPEGEVYALEVNSAPGMTATSLVPKAAKALGVEFGDFLAAIIKRSFAIKRG